LKIEDKILQKSEMRRTRQTSTRFSKWTSVLTQKEERKQMTVKMFLEGFAEYRVANMVAEVTGLSKESKVVPLVLRFSPRTKAFH